MKKIIYVASEFAPTFNAVAVRSLFQASALASAGMQVQIVTTGATRSVSDLAVVGVGGGLPTNKVGFLRRLIGESWVGLKLAVAVLFHAGGSSAVVITSPPFLVCVFCFAAATMRGLPVVLDVRDRYPQVFFSLGLLSRTSVAGRLLLFVEKWMYRRSLITVTVTNALQEKMHVETGVCPKIVRNGFDATIFFPQPKDLSNSKVRIVMHGMFGQLFDEVTFIRIVEWVGRNAAAHEFIVIGYGPKIVALSISGLRNLRVLPSMTQADIAEYIGSADIGLSVHSAQESSMLGFAVKVFEYIGCGIPSLVIPRNEAGTEVSSRGMGATFDPDGWLEAAKTLALWIEDGAARNDLRSAVIATRAEYSRQRQVKMFSSEVSAALERASK